MARRMGGKKEESHSFRKVAIKRGGETFQLKGKVRNKINSGHELTEERNTSDSKGKKNRVGGITTS